MDNNNRWIWSLIQGIVAIGAGLWMLLGRDSALQAIIYATGTYVAVAGLIQTIRGLVNRNTAGSTTDLVRGIVGLVGGAIVLILSFFTEMDRLTILTILAVLVIVYGAIGLFASFFSRGGRPFSWQPVLVNALLILLGVLFFYDRSAEIDVVLWAAVIFIAVGAIIITYALLVQRGHPEVEEAV